MLWLFGLALAALLAAPSRGIVVLLAIGYPNTGLLDGLAARREDAPPYFAALRPQMTLAVVGLLALLPKA